MGMPMEGWDITNPLAPRKVSQFIANPSAIAHNVMIDGAGYLVIRGKEEGQPIDVVYPEEGTPLATSPSVLMKGAPNPNSGKLFQNWMHSREGQQMVIDYARQYSAHAQAVEKPGVRPLKDIKLMAEDPEGVEKSADEVKRRYAQIFRV